MLWTIISWLLTGIVVGFIARAIVPGRQPLGLPLTIVLGVAGAFIGGLLSWAIWGRPIDPMEAEAARWWPGWIMSIIGATLLLWVIEAIRSRGSTDPRRQAYTH